MNNTVIDFQADIHAVASIAAVPLILEIACKTTGMGFAVVARVTQERWIACAVRDGLAMGLEPGSELKIEATLCDTVRGQRAAIVIDKVSDNPDWRSHPVPLQYGFESYISVPIILPDGAFFGTLCALDPKPAALENPEVTGMFHLFADLIAFHLDAGRRLEASEATLMAERQDIELRDQFIAVLGHDLRNPLAAIDAGTRLLQRTPLNERATLVVGQMQASVRRMSALITDVLDFARGRLGGGFIVERKTVALAPVLTQVTAEMQAALPGRRIESDFSGVGQVHCDPARIAQLLSNLLGNAVTHGAQDSPILAEARNREGMFELSVTNRGEKIPADILPNLFKPFFRISAGQQGLGLGLYIASQIAKAHGGMVSARSDAGETRFTFTMPL